MKIIRVCLRLTTDKRLLSKRSHVQKMAMMLFMIVRQIDATVLKDKLSTNQERNNQEVSNLLAVVTLMPTGKPFDNWNNTS